jgi:hypothetical protein
MGEHLAELVVAHLADIGALAAERGDPGDRVAARAAGHLDAGSHRGVELLRPRLVDQHHAALGQLVRGQEGVIGMGNDVDDGVADPQHVNGSGSHEFSSQGQ